MVDASHQSMDSDWCLVLRHAHLDVFNTITHQVGVFTKKLTCLNSVHRVYKATHSHPQKLSEAFSQLIMYFTYVFLGFVWLASSRVLLNRYALPFFLLMSVIFGRLATRMILAHVTKMPFPNLYSTLSPLLIGSLLSLCSRVFGWETLLGDWEGLYVYGLLIVTMGYHLNWCRRVVVAFCHHLDIYCFRLKPKRV